MGKYFGTDGFRGEANVRLTVEHAFQVGRFIGWYYGQDHRARIVIGKDTRRSSYMFEYAIASGIVASGADAYLMHVTTTPSVAYMVRTERFDCGVMISASHNPFYDNGIKLIGPNGQKVETAVEELIEQYMDFGTPDIPLAVREHIGRTVDFWAGRNRYIGHLIMIPTQSFRNRRVGLDCANGSTSSIAKNVFDAVGAGTYVIHNEPDGTNINRDCGSTHIEQLQRYVLDNQLDVGFAYDGDGDRCLAVDETGRVVDGDRIMFICAKYLKEQGRLKDDTLVTTVMSNLGLYKALEAAGIRYEQTAVGDRYVAECMFANDYALGGEQSGHIIFSKYARTGDGILTSLMLMEAMIEKKTSLSALADEVTIYPQMLRNVKVADKTAAMHNDKVRAEIEAVRQTLGSDGRILVRESGTEPLVRVMVEAKTDEICSHCVGRVTDVMVREGLALE